MRKKVSSTWCWEVIWKLCIHELCSGICFRSLLARVLSETIHHFRSGAAEKLQQPRQKSEREAFLRYDERDIYGILIRDKLPSHRPQKITFARSQKFVAERNYVNINLLTYCLHRKRAKKLFKLPPEKNNIFLYTLLSLSAALFSHRFIVYMHTHSYYTVCVFRCCSLCE